MFPWDEDNYWIVISGAVEGPRQLRQDSFIFQLRIHFNLQYFAGEVTADVPSIADLLQFDGETEMLAPQHEDTGAIPQFHMPGEITSGVPSLADLLQSDGETDQFTDPNLGIAAIGRSLEDAHLLGPESQESEQQADKAKANVALLQPVNLFLFLLCKSDSIVVPEAHLGTGVQESCIADA